jgi:hypothetical protein
MSYTDASRTTLDAARGYDAPRREVLAVTSDRRTWFSNHASISAIIFGVLAALLTQMLLGLAGVGFGLASFTITGNSAANPSFSAMSIDTAAWWIGSGIIASFVGGIVAGRLCGSPRHSTAGWHGFVAWCATTLVVVWMLGTALGGVLGGTFGAVAGTLSGLGKSTLAAAGVAPPDTASTGVDARVKALVNPADAQNPQGPIASFVRAVSTGDTAAADQARAAAVDSLAKTANIPPQQAQDRLNALQQQAQQAARQARDAAEQARKATAEGALFAVAALLFGMIASIIGGGLGTPRPSAEVAASV